MKRARGENIGQGISSEDPGLIRFVRLRPRTDDPIFAEATGPIIEEVEEEGDVGTSRALIPIEVAGPSAGREKGKERIRIRRGGPRGPRRRTLKQDVIADLRARRKELLANKKANAAAIRENKRDLDSFICRRKTAKQRRATKKARKSRRKSRK